MVIVSVHQARAQLSKLIERAVQGEEFIIARAGKPLVRVAAFEAPRKPRRLGFLEGEISVPNDFDRMGALEIRSRFGSRK